MSKLLAYDNGVTVEVVDIYIKLVVHKQMSIYNTKVCLQLLKLKTNVSLSKIIIVSDKITFKTPSHNKAICYTYNSCGIFTFLATHVTHKDCTNYLHSPLCSEVYTFQMLHLVSKVATFEGLFESSHLFMH